MRKRLKYDELLNKVTLIHIFVDSSLFLTQQKNLAHSRLPRLHVPECRNNFVTLRK
jgi:hypothetical protein